MYIWYQDIHAMTTNYELKNIDIEEIENLLLKVETSFNIKFVNSELAHVTTFGQLCDYITNKIQLDDSDNCTSQQAFYKIRDAISSTLQIDKKTISPNFLLADILPRQNRRLKTKKLEEFLGFKLNILRPPHWVTVAFLITLLVSIIEFFFNWKFGLSALIISIVGLWFANKIGNELDLQNWTNS